MKEIARGRVSDALTRAREGLKSAHFAAELSTLRMLPPGVPLFATGVIQRELSFDMNT